MSATVLDDILEILSDGEEHETIDIYRRIPTSMQRIQLCLNFLAEQKMVQARYGEGGVTDYVRLTEPVRKFYLETKEGGE